MKQGFRKFETKKKQIFSSNNPYTVDLDRSFSVMVGRKSNLFELRVLGRNEWWSCTV